MTGAQQRLDKFCAWCEAPATTEVEIAPAVYEKKVLKLRAQVVPACPVHAQVTEDQPPPIGHFRRRKDKSAVQLDIFGGDTTTSRPGNAITGGA